MVLDSTKFGGWALWATLYGALATVPWGLVHCTALWYCWCIVCGLLMKKNRNLVMMLGQPPTKAELDGRKLWHERIYMRLVKQYLDDGDDDANTFVFSDNEFWSLVGIDTEFCKTYDKITAEDFSDAIAYINFHYQAAYRNNKQSGNHDDFCNFVGSRHFLLYYHLWLSEAPHLLNLAVPLLPTNVMRQTRVGKEAVSEESSSSSLFLPRKKNRNTKRFRHGQDDPKSRYDDMTVAAASAAATATATTAALEQQQQQLTCVLEALDNSNKERIALLKGQSAPRRERDLLHVFSEYKTRLKIAKNELQELDNAGYASDDSDVKHAEMEVALCKRKRDETFALLSNSKLD